MLADAAEHSMMWGGVDSRAAARSVPMSMVDGSTSPSHEFDLVNVGDVGQVGHSVFGHAGVDTVVDVVVAGGVEVV